MEGIKIQDSISWALPLSSLPTASISFFTRKIRSTAPLQLASLYYCDLCLINGIRGILSLLGLNIIIPVQPNFLHINFLHGLVISPGQTRPTLFQGQPCRTILAKYDSGCTQTAFWSGQLVVDVPQYFFFFQASRYVQGRALLVYTNYLIQTESYLKLDQLRVLLDLGRGTHLQFTHYTTIDA